MDQLTQLFKALSEPLRLRIVRRLLASSREAYGEELAHALSVPPYQLSRHLKVLRSTGLIRERRAGRWVYYSIARGGGNSRVLAALRRVLMEAADTQAVAVAPRTPPPAVTGSEPGTAPDASAEPLAAASARGSTIPEVV